MAQMGEGIWLLPLLAFWAAAALHFLLVCAGVRVRQREVAVIGLVVAFSLGAIGFSFRPFLVFFFYLFLASACFGYVYFHFFNMANTARRIHILILRYKGALGDNLRNVYCPEQLVATRVERLKDIGAVIERDGKLFAPMGLLLLAAKALSRLRGCFYLKAQ